MDKIQCGDQVKRKFYETGEWYKKDYFWRRKNSDGSDGMGDLISNTCGKIYYDGETPDALWVYKSFLKCHVLLLERKRWPDSMNEHRSVTKHWFGRMVNRPINKIFGRHLPFRAQGRMTRDPFTNFYTLCMFLCAEENINIVTIPWYCNRLGFAAWRKYLITRKPIYLWIYRCFYKTPKKDFVKHLHEMRECAIIFAQSTE